jgi:hypothetical protein
MRSHLAAFKGPNFAALIQARGRRDQRWLENEVGSAMSRTTIVVFASILLSGCFGTTGVDTNADPFATGAGAVAATAPSRVTYLTARNNAKRPIAVARRVPAYSVDNDCKTTKATGDSGVHENCIQQELAAKDLLTKEWKDYPEEALNECAPASRESSSYVELMTCFEMLDWIKHPESIGGVTGTRSAHAKNEAPLPAQIEATPGQSGSSEETSQP